MLTQITRWRRTITKAFDDAPLATGTGAVGVVGLVVGALVRLLAPTIGASGTIVASVGLALVAFAALERLARTSSMVGRRRRRYGLSVTMTLVAFATLVVAVNLLVSELNVRADLTAARQFTLADQTAAILDGMESPIEATAFFVDRFDGANQDLAALRDRTENLLREFERMSDGRFSYRFVDPETQPSVALELGINRYPAVVFDAVDSGLRSTSLASSNVEQSFLTALLIATGGAQKVAYILTGHREMVADDNGVSSARGFGVAVEGLRNDTFQVASLNLINTGAVPSNAAVLIVASPLDAVTSLEAAALDVYLQGGGRILVTVEPESDRSWAAWLARWGINVGDGYVIDMGNHVAGRPGVPILAPDQYQALYITGGLDVTIFPGLAPVGFITDPSLILNLVDFDILGMTTPDSFTGMQLSQTEPSAESDIHPYVVGLLMRSVGPLDMPAPDATTAQLATLAVFGDGDFASNRFFPALSNGDLFLNVVNELTGDVPLVPVRAKPLEFRGLVITDQQFTLVRLLGWFALPLVLGAGAVIVWLRRR
ncbi:MAG: GldG family protein [Chloroflexi bacterium]|nr:GldG family protein [Chloroflexota bacterium]